MARRWRTASQPTVARRPVRAPPRPIASHPTSASWYLARRLGGAARPVRPMQTARHGWPVPTESAIPNVLPPARAGSNACRPLRSVRSGGGAHRRRIATRGRSAMAGRASPSSPASRAPVRAARLAAPTISARRAKCVRRPRAGHAPPRSSVGLAPPVPRRTRRRSAPARAPTSAPRVKRARPVCARPRARKTAIACPVRSAPLASVGLAPWPRTGVSTEARRTVARINADVQRPARSVHAIACHQRTANRARAA
jgi:hypothetical protein